MYSPPQIPCSRITLVDFLAKTNLFKRDLPWMNWRIEEITYVEQAWVHSSRTWNNFVIVLIYIDLLFPTNPKIIYGPSDLLLLNIVKCYLLFTPHKKWPMIQNQKFYAKFSPLLSSLTIMGHPWTTLTRKGEGSPSVNDTYKRKDTNRKIRKCVVHRLYARFFSSTDVYKP